MKKNIKYNSKNISEYFSQNRVTWDQFYESEKIIIEKIGIKNTNEILDIGCGCGGLGLALKEKFCIHNYTGIEINELAAQTAIRLNSEANILCGDFLELTKSVILNKEFDIVFSLSCFDWNLQFDEMLNTSWNHVKSGGTLVATFRLTDAEGCDDVGKSYQYIEDKTGEIAAYVVVNAKMLLNKLEGLQPARIIAYGYFGKPSPTAVTPYTELVFAAFAIQKKKIPNSQKPELILDLPQKILTLDLRGNQ